jgi:hypothetical protein
LLKYNGVEIGRLNMTNSGHQHSGRPRRFLAAVRWIGFLSPILFNCVLPERCVAKNSVIGACVAFAVDGALATGTLTKDELETKLDEHGSVTGTTHTAIAGVPFGGWPRHCEEAFSNDGKWLATVVPSNNLTVIILDRKTKTVYRSFSSEWHQLHNLSVESTYRSSFLGGFLQDDSLVLWRYIPRAVADTANASNADLHMQRWSVDGELLSDRNLGATGFTPSGRQPVIVNGLNLLWIPSECEVSCYSYRSVRVSDDRVENVGTLSLPSDTSAEPHALPGGAGLLSVLGQGTAQKAALLDLSGRLKAETSLPYFPNLFGPLVPDWFADLEPSVSRDGKIAAVARTRVAWVLVDTDRDWGSEIVLLKLQPPAAVTKLKTGKGGIAAMAVDHDDGKVRLVGFWGGRWHELRCDDNHPNECR